VTTPTFQFLDVLATLANGDKSVEEMIRACSHLDAAEVSRQARNLSSKGFIRPTRDGIYTLGPDGRDFLDRWLK
jgi:DNA-binding PadR family transcriptional regulator